MEKRIASFKVSSLLTLFLSVFFAFSVTSCGGNDPVDDINLVGTAWKGFVSTKNADGKLVTARVNISFLKERGRWYFDEDPTPFVSAWEREYENMYNNRFTEFSYERQALSLTKLYRFDRAYAFLYGSWIITKLTNNDFSLVVRAEEESRAVWLKVSRMPSTPTK